MTPRFGNTLNPARRFSVRLGLAVGATVTTLLGAQTLALLDKPPAKTTSDTQSAVVTPTSALKNAIGATLAATIASTPRSTLPPAPPNIIVVRNTGTGASTTTIPVKADATTGLGSIVPPSAQVAEAAPPVVQVVQDGPVAQAQAGGAGNPAPAAAVQPAPAQPAPAAKPSK